MLDLTAKHVAVFGMGRSGLSAIKFLKMKNCGIISAVNSGLPKTWGEKDKVFELIGEENCYAQENASELFAKTDLIILSPGIPREHDVLKLALAKNIPVWNEIELAYQYIDSKIPTIAVTGTNGKTTTVTFMGEMIKLCGYEVFVGGNIGVPLCELLLEKRYVDYILLELSSFQLESMPSFHPRVAVILNVYPNHGERYEKVEDYAKAKFNISRHMNQNDFLLYPEDIAMIDSWAKVQKATLIPFRLDKELCLKELAKRYDLKGYKLPGAHNIFNLAFAAKALELILEKKEGIQKAINTFPGVKYRVQYIDSNRSFVAYNDAKSTNWDATLVAVKSMDKKGRRLSLIIGGQKRGRNDSIVPSIPELKKYVDRIFLIGETSEMFASELEGHIPYVKAFRLEKVVEIMENEKDDGVLLLSPAFPSYDQYPNYEKRGEHFTKLVKGIT